MGSLACQPRTFLHAGVQAAPPGSQVRSRVCKGPLSRTRLAWRPHPAPVPAALPHGHSGVRRPFTKPPYTACPFCLPSRGVWRTPYGLPPWTGVSLSKRVSPVTWHHPPWGPCVLTVCVGGPRGDSWGVRQPGPGCPLLGGGYWEICFPKGQHGPRRAGGGGAPAQFCTHRSSPPGPRTPQPARPPLPVSESGWRQLWRPPGSGPWPAGPDGAGGCGARIRRLDPAAHRAWAHSGPAARLQPAASHVPAGHNIPGLALPGLFSPSPCPRDPRGGQLHIAHPCAQAHPT